MIFQSRVAIGVSAVAVLLAAALLYLFFIKTVPNNLIRTSGIIEAREVNLAAKISGRIAEVCCKEGDRVQAGQVVIRLDSGDLEAAVEEARAGVQRAKADVLVGESSIKTANANVGSAQADIQTAQADLDKTRAQMTDAKRQLERSRTLREGKFVSQEALDAATTTYDSAVADNASAESKLAAANAKKLAVIAQLDTAEKQLDTAKAAIGQAQATLDFNQAKLADTAISSPMAGTVVFKALEQGETVSPGQTVLTIDDLSDRYARVDIDETRVDGIVLGSEVTLTTEGSPGAPFKGRVSEIGRYAEFATQTDVKGGRQDIKTFRVKIAVDDPTGLLKPGMTVEVQIPKRAAP
ncbi:MAG TPA: efflux RND transporter periplasmic adaptor subunit [Methylomirabilota bacterium]|nr:efflux RND transporter periplasmic adaptor subunit [Methylomirabilota bacterium]